VWGMQVRLEEVTTSLSTRGRRWIRDPLPMDTRRLRSRTTGGTRRSPRCPSPSTAPWPWPAPRTRPTPRHRRCYTALSDEADRCRAAGHEADRCRAAGHAASEAQATLGRLWAGAVRMLNKAYQSNGRGEQALWAGAVRMLRLGQAHVQHVVQLGLRSRPWRGWRGE
jgi:hypothetical protein